MLEDVRNPFDVPLVRFLTPNGFHIFGVSEHNVVGVLQNVVRRESNTSP